MRNGRYGTETAIATPLPLISLGRAKPKPTQWYRQPPYKSVSRNFMCKFYIPQRPLALANRLWKQALKTKNGARKCSTWAKWARPTWRNLPHKERKKSIMFFRRRAPWPTLNGNLNSCCKLPTVLLSKWLCLPPPMKWPWNPYLRWARFMVRPSVGDPSWRPHSSLSTSRNWV